MRTLFEIAQSGLRSSERSLSVTSNNIINADTPGYSRQRVDKEAIGQQMTGYHAGLGVNITSVTRLRNEMTDQVLNEKKQDMGYMQGKARVFEQLEATMASDSGGDLDLRVGRLFDAFSELSSDPQDISVRNNLITEAQQLTNKFGDMSRNIDRTSQLVQDSAIKSVDSVNRLLSDLAGLNSSIQQGEVKGQPDHTSLDIRVKKLKDLSELVNFDSQVTDNGALELRIGGVTVLDESGAVKIKPEIDDTNKSFLLRVESGKTIEATGGKLGAQVEMYTEEIPDIKKNLDKMASTLVTEFNKLHTSGYGLVDNTVRNFFDPSKTTAADIQVNQVLVDDSRNIAASTVAGEAGNGELAAQFADMRNQALIGNNGKSHKLVDFAVDLISKPGSKLADLNSSIETRDSEISMLEAQQEREAGVNVDEELSLMIKYQNSYQGAAKVMAAAQQMYDTLISIVR